MERLNNVVKFYLTSKTSNALVINGPWGIGKTYYYKNHIEPIIQQLDYGERKFRPLMISLFGQKSVEDIQADIFFELRSPFKGKQVKMALNFGKHLAKGVMKLANLDNYYEVISDAAAKVPKESLIKLENTVLCFDDVERIGDEFNIEELIGFINSLTENNGAKIILIINEEKLEKGKKEKYELLKEKVVGNSIEFNPDLKESALNIINSKYSEDRAYHKFLLENVDFIVENFRKGSKNLRTLNFIIGYFKQIFSDVNSLITVKKEKILFVKLSEILSQALKFVIAVSIEYKENTIIHKDGQLKYGNDQGLGWTPDMVDFSKVLEGLTQGKKGNEEKSFRQFFAEKYYPEGQFYFYPSIFSFLTGGDIFIGQLFVEELKKIYKVTEGKIPRHFSLFRNLGHSEWYKLSNEQNLKTIRELLEYADKGKFPMVDYVTLFYYATRFNNPLGLNLDKLERRLIKGLKKGNHQYLSSIEMHLSISTNNVENAEYYKRIIEEIRKINEELKVTKDKEEVQKLEKLFYTNFGEFCKQTLDINGSLKYSPLFVHFNVVKLYKHLCANNKNRLNFVEYLRTRYHNANAYSLGSELDFYKKLHKKISVLKEVKKAKNVTGHLYFQVNRELQFVIQKLETKQ